MKYSEKRNVQWKDAGDSQFVRTGGRLWKAVAGPLHVGDAVGRDTRVGGPSERGHLPQEDAERPHVTLAAVLSPQQGLRTQPFVGYPALEGQSNYHGGQDGGSVNMEVVGKMRMLVRCYHNKKALGSALCKASGPGTQIPIELSRQP